MKIITLLATAAVLAVSAAAPALASQYEAGFQPEASTLLERNTYLYTTDGRAIANHQANVQVRTYNGHEAMAQAPAREEVSGQYYNERTIQ